MASRYLPPLTENIKARFWAKVAKAGAGECWEWQAAKTPGGYGVFGVQRRHHLATHVALTIDGRPRPAEMFALHSCDNRACVNPAHLRWGSYLENYADMRERGRERTTADRRAKMLLYAARGEAAASAKLTTANVITIRADTRPNGIIAHEMGVSDRTISDIKRRKTWRHV